MESTATDKGVIRVDQQGAVAKITIDRPGRMNALDEGLGEQLCVAFESLAKDGQVRAAILSGAGGNFCAGGDVEGLRRLERASSSERSAFMDLVSRLARSVRDFPRPLIAAVQGVAAGGGVGLALACDTVVMGEGTRLSFGFWRIGLVPDTGLLRLAIDRAGPAAARQLLLRGRVVDSREAFRLGLADEVVADSEVLATASSHAASFSHQPPAATALTKSLLNAAPTTLEEALTLEAKAQMMCFDSPEFREGVAAFAASRPPRF